jgi:hypothetical protein
MGGGGGRKDGVDLIGSGVPAFGGDDDMLAGEVGGAPSGVDMDAVVVEADAGVDVAPGIVAFGAEGLEGVAEGRFARRDAVFFDELTDSGKADSGEVERGGLGATVAPAGAEEPAALGGDEGDAEVPEFVE